MSSSGETAQEGQPASGDQAPAPFAPMTREQVMDHLRQVVARQTVEDAELLPRLFPAGDAITGASTSYYCSECPMPGYGAGPHQNDQADWGLTRVKLASGREVAFLSGWINTLQSDPHPLEVFYGYDGQSTVTEY